MSKVFESQALSLADDYIVGKMGFDDCILNLINLLKKAFKEKDDEACLFIKKVGKAVLDSYEDQEKKLDKYLH